MDDGWVGLAKMRVCCCYRVSGRLGSTGGSGGGGVVMCMRSLCFFFVSMHR